MARKVNRETLEHIKSFEGLRLVGYKDPGSRDGKPYTIGYGSTKNVTLGMKITAQEAERRLVDDLSNAERTVERLVKVPLNDNQFGALVSFVFNVGGGAFEDSTLLRRLNAGDYVSVPQQLARWDKNDGKVMAGLTRRRASEAELWNKPVSKVTIEPAPHLGPKPIDAPLEVKPVDVFDPDEGAIQNKTSNWIWVISAVLAFAAIIFIVTQVRF